MTFVGLALFGWVALCGLVLILCWIVTMFRLNKLNKHLKNYHYQKWTEITSVGRFGPGLSNPFRAWPYIFKDVDAIDEETLKLKDAARTIMRYSFIWASTFILSIVIGFIVMFHISNQ
jgi:hypothetical protein